METTITAQGLGVTDRFREYAAEKSRKVAGLADRAIAFEIKLSRHHQSRGSSGDDRVELTLVGPGPLVRAEASGSDKYVAFDQALAKLVERIRQAKDRRNVHRGQHKPASIPDVAPSDFKGVGLTPVEQFAATPEGQEWLGKAVNAMRSEEKRAQAQAWLEWGASDG